MITRESAAGLENWSTFHRRHGSTIQNNVFDANEVERQRKLRECLHLKQLLCCIYRPFGKKKREENEETNSLAEQSNNSGFGVTFDAIRTHHESMRQLEVHRTASSGSIIRILQ